LSGVVLVMLSVLGSMGFFSAIGVKSTLIIMEVIPFLVLAVSLLYLLFFFLVYIMFFLYDLCLCLFDFLLTELFGLTPELQCSTFVIVSAKMFVYHELPLLRIEIP
jgi:hypothetical protein